MDIRRVLCPVEFVSGAPHALGAASTIARTYDAELILVHAVAFPYPYLDEMVLGIDLDAYYAGAESAAEAKLAELTATVSDIRTRTLVLRGDPAGAIVDTVASERVDLVVMPTHARKGLKRLLMGSVTESVVRLCEAPVLTIPPTGAYEQALEVKKILIPTDFSERSDLALKPAADLAARLDARLLLLHVVTIGEGDPAGPDWAFPAISDDHVAAAMKAAEDALERRRNETDEENVDMRLVRGFDAASEILRAADDEDVDLVVMATHGHTGVMHVLLGSTTAKVIRHNERPTLTLRSH